MNNLLILTLSTSLGLALFCKSQSSKSDLADANTAAHAKLKAVTAEASDARSEARRLEKLFITKNESVQRLRTDLNVLTATEAAKESDLSELTPHREGFWPTDKPYFYLSKDHLHGLSYWPFNDGAGTLSKQAVMLLGMSEQEEHAANAAYAQARSQIRALEKGSAIPTNTPPQVATSPGTKTTYLIPAFPREAADAINHEFKSALAEVLGPARAKVLGDRIDEIFEASPYAMTKTRTLTLVRNADSLYLFESDGYGNSTSSGTTDDNGRQVIPHHVRHLFEE